MKDLTAFVLDGHPFHIRPAPLERTWMDNSPQRFAYRCLPLNIANTYGWEVLCTSTFSAVWDGGGDKEAIRIVPEGGDTCPAVSHFGGGVLTFHIPCLFQTEAGIDLFVTGPINRPKDAISALSGVVETDWSPYTFTMNWLFTRSGQRVRFEEGEPICHLFPIRRGDLEEVSPSLRQLSENPELEHEQKTWSENRTAFNASLSDPQSKAAQEQWQKSYFQGTTPSGQPAAHGHRSRLRLKPFKETIE
ncbi:DUF6065 family protein [Pseudomonas sp. LS44]|uniref:DUF6065 family protein n=1 Tax=Pseudomonas sp. LS44 TaxID=1357074 RepID=UPI00215AF347|nr:DUF6065 family protein [Pseudomonas sp. LS44]UVE17462.1 DUF6065 family protein [Pseudomonas sp. LS44]